MKVATNSQLKLASSQKKDFVTDQGSLRGENSKGVYIVYSYNIPIIAVINKVTYINKQHYSLATSKHLNMVLSSVQMTTEASLKRLIRKEVEKVNKEELCA